MSNTFDFLVIGGGVAGASAAYWLSHRGRVCVLEQESQPGYHSTSRSAAILSEAYGPRTWQILNSVTRGFFTAPPEGFAEQPVAKPLGALFLGRPQEEAAVRDQHAELTRRRVRSSLVTPDEARRLSPAVRMESFTIGLYEPDCVSLDAAAILQGFLKLARRNGAEVRLKAPVERLAYRDGTWHVTAGGQSIETAVVVNAAGAWVDDVAALAGLSRRGVKPFRRTAITIDPPAGQNALAWPMTFDMAETWYFKPEGRHIMISPADLIEVAPGDAQPEEIDVAIAVDRIETATTLKVDRIVSRQIAATEQAEEKNDLVLRRQSLLEKRAGALEQRAGALEQRAGALNSLGEPSVTGSTKPGVRYSSADDDTPMPRKRSRSKGTNDRRSSLEPRAPAPATTAPQAIPDQVAAIPVAPTQGPPNPRPSNALPTWKIQVAALLERNKRYPSNAQARRHVAGGGWFEVLATDAGVDEDIEIARGAGTATGASALPPQ